MRRIQAVHSPGVLLKNGTGKLVLPERLAEFIFHISSVATTIYPISKDNEEELHDQKYPQCQRADTKASVEWTRRC